MKVITILVLLSILLPALAVAQETPKVNVNSATLEQLQHLYRIGPALGQRIIDEREANGPYTDANQMMERVKGIGPVAIDCNRDYIVTEGETTATTKLSCIES